MHSIKSIVDIHLKRTAKSKNVMKTIKTMAIFGLLLAAILCSSSSAKAQTRQPFINYVISKLGGNATTDGIISFLSNNSDYSYEISMGETTEMGSIKVTYKNGEDFLFGLRGPKDDGAEFLLIINVYKNKVFALYYHGSRDSLLSNMVISPMVHHINKVIRQYCGYDGTYGKSQHTKADCYTWKDELGAIYFKNRTGASGTSYFSIDMFPKYDD